MVTVKCKYSDSVDQNGHVLTVFIVNGKMVKASINDKRTRIDCFEELTQEEENAAIDFASKLRNVRIERSVYP